MKRETKGKEKETHGSNSRKMYIKGPECYEKENQGALFFVYVSKSVA